MTDPKKNIKPQYARNNKGRSVSQRMTDVRLIQQAPGLKGLSRFAA